ncbi:Terminal uridylyltransferase 7 [Clonorchis sinensis]|uniref:Terminal uridylyltransferase 7 n=1 Tax=Clonorchis sinensis TaxID=79923 RepID=A0A3R7C629_CLOSI|nr:Terminal uridylyltransferase 7 [Clonorchis sinensis]
MAETAGPVRRGRKQMGNSLLGTPDKSSGKAIMDPSQIPMDQLHYLNENHIYWKEGKTKRAFVCQACGQTMPSLGASIHHSEQQSHHANLLTDQVRTVLLHLPPITPAHRLVLNQTLESAVEGVLAEPAEVERRQRFARHVIEALQGRIKDFQMVGVGNTWSGVALPDSHVDLDVCRLTTAETRDKSPQKQPKLMVVDDSIVRSPGLGYLMDDIFELLKANSQKYAAPSMSSSPKKADGELADIQTTKPSPSNGLVKFPDIYNVVRTDAEYFSISFTDANQVHYDIHTGNPLGHHVAKLLLIYLGLDARARDLATLFCKLAKLAHLDMPLNGTFPPTVLLIMVIFYLQHTSPPVLPNLHELYRSAAHESFPADSFYHVEYDSQDLSFLTDSALISKLWFPSNTSCMADLWLGLLRFYLFDFQKATYAVDIVCPNPLRRRRSGGGISSVVVFDPFDRKDLCRQISSGGFEYIRSQLLAAYGYFGVPRLTNGRHVFTNVRTHEPDAHVEANLHKNRSPSKRSTKASTPNDKSLQEGDHSPNSPVLRFTPIIDSTDGFAGNLVKVKSLVAEKFGAKLEASLLNISEVADINPVVGGTSEEAPDAVRKLPLADVAPLILEVVLDELLESADAAALTKQCLQRQSSLTQRNFLLTVTDCAQLTEYFAVIFWSKIYDTFIDKGLLVTRQRNFVKMTSFLFRMTFWRWYNKNHSNEERVNSEGSPGLESEPCEFCMEAKNQEHGIVPHQCTCKVKKPAEEEYSLGKKPSPLDDPDIVLNFEEDFDDDNVEDPTEVDCERFLESLPNDTLDHDAPFDPMNEDTVDEQNEFVEQTLDLGEDDEMEVKMTEENDTRAQRGTVDSTDGSTSFLQSDIRDKLLKAVDSLTSSKLKVVQPDSGALYDPDIIVDPGPQSQNSGDMLSEQSCSTLKVPTCEKDARTVKRTKRAAQDFENSQPPEGASVAKVAAVGRAASESLGWQRVILTRDAYGPALDDDRPNFYNSALVAKLEPENLSFSFIVRGRLPAPGKHGIRSSVLGLAAPNQPSTLLAHFESPQPQCKGCGQMGHRIGMCASAAEKSVSFVAWKKLQSSLPSLASKNQIAALTACLTELNSFHDCSGQIASRQFIVDTLQRVIANIFPSVQLRLYGSCANGFELVSSDMDLCVIFPRDSPEWRQLKEVGSTLALIRRIRAQLFRCNRSLGINRVRAILHARVPILKVSFENGFEVDISFSNHLAVINTEMLRFYTVVEPRLRVLGIALKIISKLCHIGDASVGGVSSYALIIMLIHYLQQKDQLPVLQEAYVEKEKPQNLMSGWNAWYQNDLTVLAKCWRPPEQKLSLGEMWLGFFHYYLFEFNRDVNVVCIRQKKLLSRFVKMWTSLFAIEDPFDLDHNLTCALSRDSLLSILDLFYAVLVHHTTLNPDSMHVDLWRFTLFAPKRLDEIRRLGTPSRWRCRRCRQFGHRAADCPTKDNNPQTIVSDSNVQVLIGAFLNRKPNQSINNQSSTPVGSIPHQRIIPQQEGNFLPRSSPQTGPQGPHYRPHSNPTKPMYRSNRPYTFVPERNPHPPQYAHAYGMSNYTLHPQAGGGHSCYPQYLTRQHLQPAVLCPIPRQNFVPISHNFNRHSTPVIYVVPSTQQPNWTGDPVAYSEHFPPPPTTPNKQSNVTETPQQRSNPSPAHPLQGSNGGKKPAQPAFTPEKQSQRKKAKKPFENSDCITWVNEKFQLSTSSSGPTFRNAACNRQSRKPPPTNQTTSAVSTEMRTQDATTQPKHKGKPRFTPPSIRGPVLSNCANTDADLARRFQNMSTRK